MRLELNHLVLLGAACASCAGLSLDSKSLPGDTDTGKAVYYADSLEGKKTAAGEPYDGEDFTAAHRELPFGTVARVTNLENRRTVDVRINDRGPFGKRKRIIELSRAAAERIDMIRAGVVDVRIEIIRSATQKSAEAAVSE